ncbi:tail fiber domain-containing protein [Streptomyces sp. NPDC001073]
MGTHHRVQSSDDIRMSEVLDVVVNELPISTWRYNDESGSPRHIGPMAQDMDRLFEVGDGKTIPVVDFLGLLVCCVKELGYRDRELRARISELETMVRDGEAADDGKSAVSARWEDQSR